MPKPIVCLSEQLCQFLEAFRPCLSKRQWKYFVTVLLRLIECEERKTMTGLLRVVGERISLSGLSRYLRKWPWAAVAVAQTWLLRFRQRLEELVHTDHDRLRAGRLNVFSSWGSPPRQLKMLYNGGNNVKLK